MKCRLSNGPIFSVHFIHRWGRSSLASTLLTSSSARVLGKKIKFILQVTHTIPPSKSPGKVNALVPKVISAPLSSGLLDVIAGLACSFMMFVHRENLSLSTRVMFEVRNVFYMLCRLLRTHWLGTQGVTTMPLMVVDWLNNWPIGLKLNTELSKFCSQTFMVIISSWNCT